MGRLALTEFRNNPANQAVIQNRHTYAYDVANRRQQQVRTGSSAVTLNYGYDDLGQLTSANIVGGASTAYAYDGGWNISNRAGQAYTVNDFNQVTAGEGFTYSYDSNGNRTSRTLTATGQFIQYTYDGENRLIVAQTDNVATAEPHAFSRSRITPSGTASRVPKELCHESYLAAPRRQLAAIGSVFVCSGGLASSAARAR